MQDIDDSESMPPQSRVLNGDSRPINQVKRPSRVPKREDRTQYSLEEFNRAVVAVGATAVETHFSMQELNADEAKFVLKAIAATWVRDEFQRHITQVLRPKKDFRSEPNTLKEELQAQEQTCISIAMDKIKDKFKSRTSVVLANISAL